MSESKYLVYQFIQYLFTITYQQFNDEFSISSHEETENFITLMNNGYINTLNEFVMRVKIIKNLEYGYINTWFSNNLKIEDIPDDVIMDLFYNIENRIQWFSGSEFIIIHSVSDGSIFKMSIPNQEYFNEESEELLQQIEVSNRSLLAINEEIKRCQNGQVYDVVLRITDKTRMYKNICNLRLRYLNYINQNDDQISLFLQHPYDLISVSLQKAYICNLNECVNVRNIFSSLNSYKQSDFLVLNKMKRIFMENDKYENSSNCLLEDLLQQNTLQFIKIINGENIYDNIILIKNIDDIRYLYAPGVRLSAKFYEFKPPFFNILNQKILKNNLSNFYNSFQNVFNTSKDKFSTIVAKNTDIIQSDLNNNFINNSDNFLRNNNGLFQSQNYINENRFWGIQAAINLEDLYIEFLKHCIDLNVDSFVGTMFLDIFFMRCKAGRAGRLRFDISCLEDHRIDYFDLRFQFLSTAFSTETQEQKIKKFNDLANRIRQYKVVEKNIALKLNENQISLRKTLFYMMYYKNNASTLREKLIALLYDKYSEQNKYTILSLAKSLIMCSDDQFQREFMVECDTDVKLLSRNILTTVVNCIDKFTYVSILSKNIEYHSFKIEFLNSIIDIQDIPDFIIQNLCSNIDNRILQVDQWPYGLYIHNVSTNQIYKNCITGNNYNKEQVELLFQQLEDEKQVYDIIIQSQRKYSNLSKLRIRYLNYINATYNNSNFVLNHPEDLVSATLYKIKMQNMNSCTNLTNIYSYANIFKKHDFELQRLKRVMSTNDTYISKDGSLIQHLFKNNALEYLYIYNQENKNVISSAVLSQNIGMLRYMYVEQFSVRFSITLDVTSEFPDHLSVFDVKTGHDYNDTDNVLYGQLSGAKNSIHKIKKQLIHEFKE